MDELTPVYDPIPDLAQLICLAGRCDVNAAVISVPLTQLRTGLVIDDPASAGPGIIEDALRDALDLIRTLNS